jgi:diadenosine tetraphosphate (Ap4A) HIT family hydrolase
MQGCELCEDEGGELLWQDDVCRVVRVGGADGAAFPGFCRVIWQAHVREMSDLPAASRQRLMQVVFAVEQAVREIYRPDKVNLASLGNLTPHLHWHVIPRHADDSHFPAPVWAAPRRPAPVRAAIEPQQLCERLGHLLSDAP